MLQNHVGIRLGGVLLALAIATTWWGSRSLRPTSAAEREATTPRSASKTSKVSSLGKSVADFTLKDFRGKSVSLSDFSEKPVIVIAYLGVECPLAKLYGPRLAKLSQQFDKQVAVLAINANQQDSLAEMTDYAKACGFPFPFLKDAGNQVADRMGAERTPEVFVLDKERVVRYRGRIDDQYGIGYVRNAPDRKDLEEAIRELLAGKPVSVAETTPHGCLIGRLLKPAATGQESASVTYHKHVAPILHKRCVECHRDGEIAPFSLTNYSEVVGWAETIAEVIEEERMPPWHASPKHSQFLDDRRMSPLEKQTIYDWVAAGAPEGNVSDQPALKAFPDTGWHIDREPDLVVAMRNTPYRVPAEGEIRYQHFAVDPKFTEDKWVMASQVLPGARQVVHHCLVLSRPIPGRGDGDDAVRGFIAGYVPGRRERPYPPGMAKRIPAGTQFIFQMHYTPNGTPQDDLTKVAFWFADPKSIEHEVRTTSAAQRRLSIPPGANNHREEATSPPAPLDGLLLGFMPHLHVRGKSFFYELVQRDGSKDPVLDIPRYDFNWQTYYMLGEPKKVPAGSRMHVVAHYDNSAANRNNPNPKETVRWGDQTWEEMLIGYFDIAFPRAQIEKGKPAEGMPDDAKGRAEEVLKRFDKNGDGKVTKDEVPERLLPLFRLLDRDSNGELTVEELKRLPRNGS